MLSEDRFQSRLRALHKVLTRVRSQAYLGLEPKAVGRILDDTEYLVTLLISRDDTEEFRQYLKRIEERNPGFDGLVAFFDAAEAESSVVVKEQRVAA